jgi:hypothetical protein
MLYKLSKRDGRLTPAGRPASVPLLVADELPEDGWLASYTCETPRPSRRTLMTLDLSA